MSSTVESQRGQHLLRALRGTDITVFYQDADLKYVWIENPPIGWVLADIIGQDDYHILPKEAAETVTEAKKQVLSNQTNRSLELEVKLPDGNRWFDIWIDPDFDDQGAVQGILCFSVEITDKKSKEENLRQLLLEVSHRSRNLLAIVQSIASQSLRTADNEEALGRFNARIQSFAISLDLVTTGEWEGATLDDLIAKQTRPYLTDGSKLSLNGLNPQLTPNAAMHIGLAIQELISNTARENQNNIDPKDINIKASLVEHEGRKNAFVFEWKETTHNRCAADDQQELGSRTLRQVVPAALAGSSRVSHSQDVLVYSLTVPAGNFS